MLLSDFNKLWNFSTDFYQYRISRKSVQREPKCSIRTDGRMGLKTGVPVPPAAHHIVFSESVMGGTTNSKFCLWVQLLGLLKQGTMSWAVYRIYVYYVWYYIVVMYILHMGRDRVVGTATRYRLDGPEIESRWRRDFPALGPTQPPIL
jgi:hypothetical protein